MPDFTRPLGDAVRDARTSQGLTQREVANRIDIDVRTVLNIENYKGNPKIEILYPLIRTLNIDPLRIFYPERHSVGDTYRKMQLLMTQCTEKDLEMLYSVSTAILSVLHNDQPMNLSLDEKEPVPL